MLLVILFLSFMILILKSRVLRLSFAPSTISQYNILKQFSKIDKYFMVALWITNKQQATIIFLLFFCANWIVTPVRKIYGRNISLSFQMPFVVRSSVTREKTYTQHLISWLGHCLCIYLHQVTATINKKFFFFPILL